MDKRIVSILLAIVMIFGNVASLAAEGDIIHTGLKKIYRKDNPSEQEEIVNDILNGTDVKEFYREVANGEYVNIKEEEDAQLAALAEIVQNNSLKTAEEIQEYIKSNRDEVEKALNNVKVSTKAIDTTAYNGATNAPLLTEKHFSTPEPGYKEGTTKITTLNLPNDASSWRIQVLDSPVEPMRKDTILEGATGYIKGRDIEIEKDKYLVLYAVDSSNRIKAYANIKITNEMIKQPREEALKLEIGSIKAGSSYAGTVVISGLDKLPEDATKWQVVVSSSPVDTVYKGDKLNGAVDYVDGEITVADENELVNMSDSFKKYVILIAADNDGKAVGYRIFEVGSNDISKAPTLLKETTNYVGPVPGGKDGTTVFTKLSFEDNTEWKIKISDDKPKIPALDSKADGTPYSFEEDSKNIKIKPKQYLMLLATIGGKIKGYKIFEMEENQVKGKTATEIKDNTIKLEKGSIEGTTKVVGLNLTNINGATKWMYVVGKNLSAPMLDKLVDGSMNYTPENDIKVAIDDNIMILATDDEGKVKAYVKFKLTSEAIKDPAPILLKENVDFTTPVKGSTKGTTKIEKLTPIIEGINHWRYKIDTKPFDIPEIDKMVDGSQVLEAGKDIGKDLTGNEYILILATVKDTEDENKYATKGYATFQLSEKQVYMGEATNLISDNAKWKDNISQPEPGIIENTTKIAKLNTLGLPGGDTITEWRYKVLQEKIETPIEFNSKIDRTTKYNVGNNIRVNVGEYLLIVATDRYGNVKAYAQFEIEAKNVRSPNAPLLIGGTNYKIQGPEPGSVENSTKFSYLDFSTNIVGATKWKYIIGDKSFGSIEYDSVLKEATEYTDNIGEDIENVSEGKYLLLLATDNGKKVKAYKEFRLTIDQIRGTKAKELATDTNYIIEKGDKPGTTKFSKLDPIGAAGVSNWKYKLIETVEEKDQIEKEIYINYIVKDTIGYTSGRDIPVKEINTNEPKYGYMLLLATDSNSRTKGYAIIDVKSDVVKEHAEKLDVKLVKGTKVDTVKVVKEDSSELPTTNKYKKLVTKTIYPTPAKGEVLKTGDEYKGEDISVFVGDYVTIFEVIDNNEIQKFNSMEVTKDDINSVKAILTGDSTSSNTLTIPEDRINSGGQKITITLGDGATWEDLKKDKAKRDTLYNSFRPSNQSTEWTKVVTKLIDDGGTLAIDDETLSFFLPMTEKYDISEDQEITLTIPATCVTGARNNIDVKGNIIIKPIVEATIKGDVVSSIVRQKDLKAGGKSIIIELGDGEWIGDIADKKDTLFDCFKVIGEDGKVVTTTTEWSKIVGKLKSSSEPNTIIRNSSKMVTITLPEVMDVDLGTSYETIKLTILQDLIEGATSDVVATPTFTLYPDRLQVKGNVAHGKDTITMIAPDNKEVKEGSNTWIIEVTEGTLKDEITVDDLIIAGLPRGLKAEAKKDNDKQIEISISGIASSSVASDQVVKIRIKGSAVTDLNSIDSDDIVVNIKTGEAKILDEVNYSLETKDSKLVLYLTGVDEEMQYSLNSTNGINGTWGDISLGQDSNKINLGDAKPMRIFVREKTQPKVFKEVVDLKYEEMPKDVYVNNVSYSGNKCTITLGGIDKTSDYECSIDGGNTWIEISDEILLDEKSDLRIRKKSVPGDGGKLPSLPTAKLNGEFLGNVKMNVGEGKILDTTTNMEYSLDGDKYTSARSIETSVNFVQGIEVWIRERRKPENKISLGKVGQQEQFSEVELDNISYNIKDKSITNSNTGFYIEYKIGSNAWKNVDDGKNIEFKPGSLQFRKKGTADKLPSAPVEKTVIKSPASPPELRIDDYNKNIEYMDNGEWKAIDDKLEFKVENEETWSMGSEWNTAKENIKFENTVVYVRNVATSTELPSQVKTINFTKNLSFGDVKVNVVEGYIEGTTSNMEYSTNSIDGKNGSWNSCLNEKTKVELVEGMKVWIREKGKIENNNNGKPILEKVERQPKPTLNNVTFDISLKSISNTSDQDLEYRIGEEPWKKIDKKSNDESTNVYEVDFKSGVLQFRTRGTIDSLPSFPVDKATIKAPESAPNLEYDDVKYTISKIGKDEGKDYEYSINNNPWIDGIVDTQFTEKDTVRIRKKATWDALASQEQTIKFTPNLDLNDVKLDAGNRQILKTTTTMEYSVNSTDGLNGTWNGCSSPSTKIGIVKDSTVYVREKAKPKNNRKVNENPIGEKETKNIPLGKIDFNIKEGTITIPKNQVGQLQYKFGSSANWININTVTIYNVGFVAGELQFRLKGDEQSLPSKPVTKVVIVAAESEPNVVTKLDIGTADKYNPKNIIKTINGKTANETINDKTLYWSKFEYSIDNSPWKNGVYLKTEDLNRSIKVRIRKVATATELASQFETVDFKEVLNLAKVGLSTHVQPLELNGTTTQMEYGIWLGSDSNNYLYDGKWFGCNDGNTELQKWLKEENIYKIEIRDKNQQANLYTVYKKTQTQP